MDGRHREEETAKTPGYSVYPDAAASTMTIDGELFGMGKEYIEFIEFNIYENFTRKGYT